MAKANTKAFYLALFLPNLLLALVLQAHHWLPTGDTLGNLFTTHYFFSNFWAHGEFPRWSPYIDWGKDSKYYFVSTIRPSVLLLGLVAKITGGIHVARLYYGSFFVDELYFIFGVAYLARQLYRSRLAQLFVGLSIGGSVAWAHQLFFCFTVFYFFPLPMGLIWKGLRARRPRPVVIGQLLFSVFSCFGNVIYFLPFQLVYLAIFVGVVGWSLRIRPAEFIRKVAKVDVVLAGLGLTFFLLPLFLLWLPPRPVILGSDRGAEGVVAYAEFLRTNFDSVGSLLLQFICGVGEPDHVGFFQGILVLPFLILGLVNQTGRKRFPFVVLAGFAFLALLGAQSFVAPLFRLLPAADRLRNLGGLSGFLKLPAVFIAGFGFDSFVRLTGPSRRRSLRRSLMVIGVFLLVGLTGKLAAYYREPGRLGNGIDPRLLVLVLAGGSLVALAHFARRSRKSFVIGVMALLIVVSIDVNSYRSSLFHNHLKLVSDPLWSLLEPRPLPFAPRRVVDYASSERFRELRPLLHRHELDPESFRAMQLRGRPYLYGSMTWSIFNVTQQFLGFDPCRGVYLPDFVSAEVAPALRYFNMSSVFRNVPPESTVPFTRSVLTAVGCESDKLRLFASAKYGDAATMARYFATSGSPAPILWLQGEGKGDFASVVGAGEIDVTSFRPNEISFRVANSQTLPAWLVYADAANPDWRATINGVPTPIVQANGAFKSVVVPAGISDVRFRYHPSAWRWLVGIAMAGALVYAIVPLILLGNPHFKNTKWLSKH